MQTPGIRVWVMVAGLCLASEAWGQSASAQTQTDAGPVSASQCWIRQLPAPAPSGGFLLIHNSGASTAVLKSVDSPDYKQVMMHQTTESGGMSSMSAVHDLKVPAGGDLAFRPGSYHLMLEQPRAGLKVGDTVEMRFRLADGAEFSAACAVKPANAMPGMRGMPGMSGRGDMKGMSGHGMR
ncbi:copper chaperone PCu(A)C [Castellaniella sp.]|uniref:copper chaperone PCu(A)C n=1 Tax=Castellaniella sp. TaxID=1955812 RepID=UPI0025C3D039|nr:copper chaperone PCu(A)C [Castellaniella sp.]